MQETRTRLDLPVRMDGSELNFAQSCFGPGDFVTVGRRMEAAGLTKPTLAQTAALAHAAWEAPENPAARPVIEFMTQRWLWGDTAFLYVPGGGVFIQDHPTPKGPAAAAPQPPLPQGISMDLDELRQHLGAGDPNVRFVPFGFKTGEQTASDLTTNPFVIALLHGEEGARKVAEIADHHSQIPNVWSLDAVDELTVRVAALGSNFSGDQLVISGRGYDIGPNGNGMCGYGLL